MRVFYYTKKPVKKTPEKKIYQDRCSCLCCHNVKNCKLTLSWQNKNYKKNDFKNTYIHGNNILEGILHKKEFWGETEFDICDDKDPTLRYIYTDLNNNNNNKTLSGVQTRVHNNSTDPHSAKKDWKTPFDSRYFVIELK